MTQFGIESLSDLVTRAMSVRERDLKMAVVDAMTTNETLWFRDTYLPAADGQDISRARQEWPTDQDLVCGLLFWAGALLHCHDGTGTAGQKPGTLPGGVQIVGTDISSTMLNQCKEGCTTVWRWLAVCRPSARNCSSNLTVTTRCGWWACQKIDHLPAIEPAGKLQPAWQVRHHLLSQRAHLFCTGSEVKILNQFAASLNPGGYLMLGLRVAGRVDRQVRDDRCNPASSTRLNDPLKSLFGTSLANNLSSRRCAITFIRQGIWYSSIH